MIKSHFFENLLKDKEILKFLRKMSSYGENSVKNEKEYRERRKEYEEVLNGIIQVQHAVDFFHVCTCH